MVIAGVVDAVAAGTTAGSAGVVYAVAAAAVVVDRSRASRSTVVAGSKEALCRRRDETAERTQERRLRRVGHRHNWVQSVLGAEKAPLDAEPSILLLFYMSQHTN